MKKKKPVKIATGVKQTVRKIVEYYFMIPAEIQVKALSSMITVVNEKDVEIWNELNLMEVVLESDSLIFQDARECFEDPLDLEFIEQKEIKTIYQISFDLADQPKVCQVMKELMEKTDGIICSDTEDFEPIYTKEMRELF